MWLTQDELTIIESNSLLPRLDEKRESVLCVTHRESCLLKAILLLFCDARNERERLGVKAGMEEV